LSDVFGAGSAKKYPYKLDLLYSALMDSRY
jgi:hypothetical protein